LLEIPRRRRGVSGREIASGGESDGGRGKQREKASRSHGASH
jgi:hypothetical protein